MWSEDRLYQIEEGMNVKEMVTGISIGGLMSRPHHLRFLLARLHSHKVDTVIPDFTGRSLHSHYRKMIMYLTTPPDNSLFLTTNPF